MNDMRKLMEAVEQIVGEEYYLDEPRDAADLLSEFDSELDELLNRYWTEAESIAASPEEAQETHQKLEGLLQSFITDSIRG